MCCLAKHLCECVLPQFESVFVSMSSSSRPDIDSANGRHSPRAAGYKNHGLKAPNRALKPQRALSDPQLSAPEACDRSQQPTDSTRSSQRQNSAEIAANLISEELSALELQGYGPSTQKGASKNELSQRQSTSSAETHPAGQHTTQVRKSSPNCTF